MRPTIIQVTRREIIQKVSALCVGSAALIVPTSCFTGERPHFNDDPLAVGSPTGDEAIDAVLSKLDSPTDGPATAVYTVLTKYGNGPAVPATVVLNNDQRAIEVATTRFIDLSSEQFTCTIDPVTTTDSDCVNGFDAARISDVGITINFYAAEAAIRLRRDAQARLAAASASKETIGNQEATCASVPLPGGTAIYCVLSNGMIAKLDDGDVLITLGLLVPTADSTKLAAPDL